VRLLLDTHALLWSLAEPETLRPEARAAIESAESSVAVSAASMWEISIKTELGRLRVPDDFLGAARAARFAPLPITWEHGLAAGLLPHHHRNPFDRMLVAQAQLEGLTIVTRDPRIGRYAVQTLPA
jgi:PIN domain nuclease of toxin-antitoxin system